MRDRARAGGDEGFSAVGARPPRTMHWRAFSRTHHSWCVTGVPTWEHSTHTMVLAIGVLLRAAVFMFVVNLGRGGRVLGLPSPLQIVGVLGLGCASVLLVAHQR